MSQYNTVISYYPSNSTERVDEDFSFGHIYPFRSKDWFRRPELAIYDVDNDDVYLEICFGNDNLQSQLANREYALSQIAIIEQHNGDVKTYCDICNKENEIIPAETFLSLEITKVNSLEDWANEILEENQKDWHLLSALLPAIDFDCFTEELLKKGKLASIELRDGYILYPNL